MGSSVSFASPYLATISWADAHNRALPIAHKRMNDDEIEQRIVAILGDKRLSFIQIQAGCMQYRMRRVLAGMCMAGKLKVDHQQACAPILRGKNRCAPKPKAMYNLVKL